MTNNLENLCENFRAARANRLEKYGTVGLISMANALKERIDADLKGEIDTPFGCGACVSNEDSIIEILHEILAAYETTQNRSE